MLLSSAQLIMLIMLWKQQGNKVLLHPKFWKKLEYFYLGLHLFFSYHYHRNIKITEQMFLRVCLLWIHTYAYHLGYLGTQVCSNLPLLGYWIWQLLAIFSQKKADNKGIICIFKLLLRSEVLWKYMEGSDHNREKQVFHGQLSFTEVNFEKFLNYYINRNISWEKINFVSSVQCSNEKKVVNIVLYDRQQLLP